MLSGPNPPGVMLCSASPRRVPPLAAVYHPANVYPLRDGAAGRVIEPPVVYVDVLTLLPPEVLYVTT